MCKEMPVILVNRVVDTKRIIGKNGGLRRTIGTRGRRPPPPKKTDQQRSNLRHISLASVSPSTSMDFW
jgi:hypothetical protein